MKEKITLTEMPDYEQELSRGGLVENKAYVSSLEHSGYLSMIFTSPEEYTVVWPGQINFQRLGDIAVSDLSDIVSLKKLRLNPRGIMIKQVASFAFNISGRIIDGKLSSPETYKKYTDALDDSSEIAFARFNIESPLLKYYFTARNNLVNSEEPELSIALPRDNRWSTSLVDWFINHHEIPDLKSKINPTEFIDTINKTLV